MNKFFRNHSIAILSGLATLFLAVIIMYYIWGVSYLLMSEANAMKQGEATDQVPQFDLAAAAKLDYRGILPSTSD